MPYMSACSPPQPIHLRESQGCTAVPHVANRGPACRQDKSSSISSIASSCGIKIRRSALVRGFCLRFTAASARSRVTRHAILLALSLRGGYLAAIFFDKVRVAGAHFLGVAIH